jgi:2,4-dienoyl-CoA reductase-like NADH-dependent reductase (Old Yellow Enzyme family)
MSHPKLLEPLTIGDVTLANRIMIAPVRQYPTIDGQMHDWHLIHSGQLAL